jgi:hypothetical protein
VAYHANENPEIATLGIDDRDVDATARPSAAVRRAANVSNRCMSQNETVSDGRATVERTVARGGKMA